MPIHAYPPSLTPPPGRILLHACCAVCAGGSIDRLLVDRLPFTVVFFNPNLFPDSEHDRRLLELSEYCLRRSVTLHVIHSAGDHDLWNHAVRDWPDAPERGPRCFACILFRLQHVARQAGNLGCSVLATTLASGRQKDPKQIAAAGQNAVAGCQITFWPCDWRRAGGQILTEAIAKRERFYRQNYCGCEFSVRRAI